MATSTMTRRSAHATPHVARDEPRGRGTGTSTAPMTRWHVSTWCSNVVAIGEDGDGTAPSSRSMRRTHRSAVGETTAPVPTAIVRGIGAHNTRAEDQDRPAARSPRRQPGHPCRRSPSPGRRRGLHGQSVPPLRTSARAAAAVAGLRDGFVGDAERRARDEAIALPGVRREVQVGEKDLAGRSTRDLDRLRFVRPSRSCRRGEELSALARIAAPPFRYRSTVAPMPAPAAGPD